MTQSWLPQYFPDVLSVELKDVGIFAVMPYIAGVVFDNVWAVLIDHLIARGTLSTLGARKFSQAVAFAAPSLCIGVLLGLGERVTPVLASALFSAALGVNMASHSGYWANLIDIAPTKAGFALGVSNTIGNVPGTVCLKNFAWVGLHVVSPDLAGIYGNILTGFVLASSGSWVAVFGIAIAHWVVGLGIYTAWSSADEVF